MDKNQTDALESWAEREDARGRGRGREGESKSSGKGTLGDADWVDRSPLHRCSVWAERTHVGPGSGPIGRSSLRRVLSRTQGFKSTWTGVGVGERRVPTGGSVERLSGRFQERRIATAEGGGGGGARATEMRPRSRGLARAGFSRGQRAKSLGSLHAGNATRAGKGEQ